MAAKNTNALTAERARELSRYDPESGRLFWAVDRRKTKSGAEAGTNYKGRNWYRQVCVDYTVYRAHRVIWLIMTGEWPKGEIDHIDGDGLNNRWDNIRDVGREENSHNMRRPTNNSSGCSGVRWHKRAGKWGARIYKDNREVHIGLFDTKAEAIQARKDAEESLGYHKNHGRTA